MRSEVRGQGLRAKRRTQDGNTVLRSFFMNSELCNQYVLYATPLASASVVVLAVIVPVAAV